MAVDLAALIEVYVKVGGFDPNEPRNPHTGEWIDSPGAEMDALKGLMSRGTLHLDGSLDDPALREMANAILRIPQLKVLEERGNTFHLSTQRNVTEIPSRGRRGPLAFTGGGSVVGEFDFGNKEIAVGEGAEKVPEGRIGVLWHEAGHAVGQQRVTFRGHQRNLDVIPPLRRFWEKAGGKPESQNPYQHAGNSIKEFWADVYRDLIGLGDERFVAKYGESMGLAEAKKFLKFAHERIAEVEEAEK